MALVGVLVAAAAGLARGLPDPELMANLDNSCLEFSQDGGTVWGDVSVIELDESFVPVPGGEYLQGDFLARNVCATPATLQVYAGRWDVSPGASGTWRTDLAGGTGSPVTLTGPAAPEDWGVLVGETAAPRNQAIPVRLFLGIPAAETMQSYSITPGWAFALEETAPTDAPAAPTVEVAPQSPTTDDRVTVTGTAEPGSTVEVTVDGVVRCTTTATPEGTYSCDLGTLPRGEHVISATATNAADTSDPADGVTVTVRSPGSGWGSLDDLLGLGSLAGLLGFGSLGGLIGVGSLGSLGDALGSLVGIDGSASSGGTGSTGSAGGPGGGQGSNGSSGSAGSSGSHQGGGNTGGGHTGGSGSGAGSSWGSQAGSDSGSGSGAQAGSGGTASGAPGGQATHGGGTNGEGAPAAGTPAGGGSGTGGSAGSQAAGSQTGQIPHAALGIGEATPGGATGTGVAGFADTGAPATGSLGRTAGLGSVENLIHLGGPTIRVGS